MSDITGQAGELKFTVQVTRKETGKVEEVELVSIITEQQAQTLGLNTTSQKED